MMTADKLHSILGGKELFWVPTRRCGQKEFVFVILHATLNKYTQPENFEYMENLNKRGQAEHTEWERIKFDGEEYVK